MDQNLLDHDLNGLHGKELWNETRWQVESIYTYNQRNLNILFGKVQFDRACLDNLLRETVNITQLVDSFFSVIGA